jgi:hypothetical protein
MRTLVEGELTGRLTVEDMAEGGTRVSVDAPVG